MKTIRQIANEIGVSKQAVYKRVKGSLHTVVAPYAHTVDGTMYIDVIGETFIKSAFSENTDNPKSTYGAHTSIYGSMSILEKQLEIKDKQISELQQNVRVLTAALQNTTDSLKSAHALHAGTIHKQLTGFSVDKPEGDSPPEEPPTAPIEADKPRFLERVKQFFK